MLLFQDLAVVPLLVLIPVLGQPADAIGIAVAAGARQGGGGAAAS